MSESKHKPLPWDWEAEDASSLILGTKDSILENHVLSCARCKACQSRGTVPGAECGWPSKEDGGFILLAVNSHYDLIAACDKLRKAIGPLAQAAMHVNTDGDPDKESRWTFTNSELKAAFEAWYEARRLPHVLDAFVESVRGHATLEPAAAKAEGCK